MRCTILEECRINTSPGPDTNRHGGAPRGARPLPGDAGRVRPRPRAGHKRALARLHEHVRHAKPGVFAAPGRLSALRPPLIGVEMQRDAKVLQEGKDEDEEPERARPLM